MIAGWKVNEQWKEKNSHVIMFRPYYIQIYEMKKGEQVINKKEPLVKRSTL